MNEIEFVELSLLEIILQNSYIDCKAVQAELYQPKLAKPHYRRDKYVKFMGQHIH